jgi:hypothetical protein
MVKAAQALALPVFMLEEAHGKNTVESESCVPPVRLTGFPLQRKHAYLW